MEEVADERKLGFAACRPHGGTLIGRKNGAVNAMDGRSVGPRNEDSTQVQIVRDDRLAPRRQVPPGNGSQRSANNK